VTTEDLVASRRNSRGRLLTSGAVVAVVAAGAFIAVERLFPSPRDAVRTRRALFAELRPVRLANCELARFGEPNDGGYLLCANLLENAAAGYSYGISGYDQWGCDVATRRRVPVHQYDCFDLERPSCAADTRFHEECVAGRAARDGAGRRFDTIERQLVANGHGAARVVMKMDVEGAEWHALAAAPDRLLERIDQLAIEFHGTDDGLYLAVVRRLTRFFHVAHLHFNNYSCRDGLGPFPAWAYEALLVNKRIGVAGSANPAPRPHPLDAPNNPAAPDCPGR
jgi:hypothetical protein